MANETTVVVKEGGNLHPIMEALEGISYAQAKINKQLEESGERVAGQFSDFERTISSLTKRCDELDQKLPRGSKIYVAETASKTDGLYEFGRCITEAWRLKHYGRVSPEFAEMQRAPGQQTTANAASGDVVVPVVTYDKIARIIGEASIIRKIATIIPMTTNVMNMPTKGTGPSVYWPTATTGEGTAPTKTSVQLAKKTLTTHTMMALDEITSELTEDSIVALEPFFAQVFAEAVAAEENKQAFSSTTPFQGVGNDAGITRVYFGGASNSGKNAFSTVVHQDMVNLQFAVDTKLVSKGVWILSAGAFSNIVALKDTQNRPIYMTSWSALPGIDTPADQAMGTPTTIMGRPAFLTDAMPGTSSNSQLFAIYGDFSRFAFGDRKSMSIDWSDQVYFESANLALRVRERIAMVTLIPGAFARLTTAI
jgi:HK97 family phage major capsid protein